jgi:uncharacterized membrane protein YeiH
VYIRFILEMIGTIAFAISGAITGIQKKMDIFGVAILGLTTAVGGGILRDLILNITPPLAFKNPVFAVTSILVSIIVFIRSNKSIAKHDGNAHEVLLQIMDSVGLGVFTVVGVQVAKESGTNSGLFLETFVGVLTGVGGGLLRDIFAQNMPSIFVKYFYACASILGAWMCVCLWPFIGENWAMSCGAALVVALRILAARYHWSLPRAK